MAEGDLGAVRRSPRSARDDHAEIIVPAAQPGAGATNDPASVSAGAGNGTGDLRAKLIEGVTRHLDADEDVHAYVDVDVVNERLSTVAAAVADALIAEGWRPPTSDAAEPDEDACPHCSPTHERPESRPWGVYVAPSRDGDGQPTHLVVQPSNGAHVAQSDADWLWQLIRDYRPEVPRG